jgi:prevent-host-death family protein
MYTATQARKKFFTILEDVQRPGISVIITHEGQPKGVFMSVEDFEGWQETHNIMSDPDPSLHKDILEGIREMKSGKRPKNTISLGALKKKLKI